MPSMIVRKARREDIPRILELIEELAIYERAPHEVTNTVERMLNDGFGERKIFDAFVCEESGDIIGAAITYFRYSTWKGKCLYLEDLIITEAYRRKGAGKLLFDHCVQFGRDEQCVRMNWQVLDWNEPAINFYKTYNAELDGEWLNGSLEL